MNYRIFDPSAGILRCFACHSTGPLTQAADGALVPHELGIRCEACHGPAAAHARDPKQNSMPDPQRLSASELNNRCGECHRMPAAAGDATDLHNPWNARHQPLMLAASACFRESKSGLSCIACHSPHAPVEKRLAAYDAACGNCHAAPHHRQQIAGIACAQCHMPRSRAGAYLTFTNHRIAIYGTDPMVPVRAAVSRPPR